MCLNFHNPLIWCAAISVQLQRTSLSPHTEEMGSLIFLDLWMRKCFSLVTFSNWPLRTPLIHWTDFIPSLILAYYFSYLSHTVLGSLYSLCSVLLIPPHFSTCSCFIPSFGFRIFFRPVHSCRPGWRFFLLLPTSCNFECSHAEALLEVSFLSPGTTISFFAVLVKQFQSTLLLMEGKPSWCLVSWQLSGTPGFWLRYQLTSAHISQQQR